MSSMAPHVGFGYGNERLKADTFLSSYPKRINVGFGSFTSICCRIGYGRSTSTSGRSVV